MHDETSRFLGGAGSYEGQVTRFLRNAGSWLVHDYGTLTVMRRDTQDIIGTLGLFYSWRDLGPDIDGQAEAGWILRHDCAGQGYAREAMEAVLAWFDSEHGRRVICMIEPANFASINLAERLGFTPMRETKLPEDAATVCLFERAARQIGR